jgi:hypothetical protein
MATGRKDRSDVPLPVRGGRCLDFWQVPDVLEQAAIRARVASFDEAVAAVAAELQREQRRERRRRERARKSVQDARVRSARPESK